MPDSPRIGSLCSGYGGLDLGLMAVVGGSVAWHVEYDKHPSAVLDARFPGVPNYGDITTTDWSQVEPVDWLTAGYPCQPFSHAGKRKGKDDERHLWPFVADAIGVLRPGRVLLENVAGHVSLGLDAVLWDLAALGYDATWGVVRASDAGAPHNRARIFIVAADADSLGHERGGDARGRWGGSTDDREPATHTERGRRSEGRDAAQGGQPDAARSDRGGRSAPDTAGEGSQGRWSQRSGEAEALTADCRSATDAKYAGRDTTAPTREVGRDESVGRSGLFESPRGAGSQPDWGNYATVIRRWEYVIGRPAPRPTEPGRTGERLSPRFVEWLMGLPDGWVTDVLPRNPALKALGNGVVPQQAALAVRTLLSLERAAVA